MNKYLISCISVGCLLAAGSAWAAEVSPYVAARASFVDLRNNADNRAVFEGNGALFPNTIVDGTLSDNVTGFRVAYGIQKDVPQIWGGVRAEIEYGYNGPAKEKGTTAINSWGQNVDLTWKQKTRSQTVMLNGYYDVKTGTPFTPYIGGGIGYAHLKTSAAGEIWDLIVGGTSQNLPFSGHESRNNFAWNLGAGLAYNFTKNIIGEVGYRYTHLGYTKSSSTTQSGFASAKYKISTHEVQLGMRYQF